MWLPPEQVTLTDGRTVVAYVVDVGDGWTTLLQDHDRTLIRVRTDLVQRRETCRVGKGAPSRSLMEIIFRSDPTKVPRCG